MSKWTDEQAREAFLALPMAYNADDSITSDTVIAGRRILDLEAELADIKASYRATIDEPCDEGLVHCTCVPALRAEVASMRAVVEAAEPWAEVRRKLSLEWASDWATDERTLAGVLHDAVDAYRAQQEGK